MASWVQINPVTKFAKALFNFDEVGGGVNFKISGLVRYSTSDSFNYFDYISTNYSNFYSDIYTKDGLTLGELRWLSSELATIKKSFATISQFVNVSFVWAGDFDTVGSSSLANPEDVGRSGLSDINISAIFRTDVRWSGLSGGGSDKTLGYTGGAGDIFLNTARYNYSDLIDFDEYSRINQTLMHEILHGLGMSHPFKYVSGVRTVTSDFSALLDSGFQNLGFQLTKPSDVNKEYFTIMSYDDQPSLDGTFFEPQNAFTPMIFDVLALQEIYGEGQGTSGFGNDVIEAGTIGYRTYFDRGGIDTIDLKYYETGGYVDLGESIGGSKYEVGIVLNLTEADRLWNGSGNPQHLRWLYGNIENVSGSAYNDLVIDSDANNYLFGASGDDTFLMGRKGSDTINGAGGIDRIVYFYNFDQYSIRTSGAEVIITSNNNADYGTDVVSNIEYFDFNDQKSVTLAALLKGPANKDIIYVFKSEKTGAGGNPASYSYFYTVDAAEANYIKGQASWPWVQKVATFEAAHSNPLSSVPVFRFWSDKHQSHFFTINSAEKDQIINWSKTGTNGYDWKFEGEGFRVYADGTTTDGLGKSAIPVYRLWMDDKDFNAANGLSGGHFFTADKGEYDSMIKLVGVKGEGIAFYGEPPGG